MSSDSCHDCQINIPVPGRRQSPGSFWNVHTAFAPEGSAASLGPSLVLARCLQLGEHNLFLRDSSTPLMWALPGDKEGPKCFCPANSRGREQRPFWERSGLCSSPLHGCYSLLFYQIFLTYIKKYGSHYPGFMQRQPSLCRESWGEEELRNSSPLHSVCFAEHVLMKYAYAERWLGCNSSFWLKCCFLYVYWASQNSLICMLT